MREINVFAIQHRPNDVFMVVGLKCPGKIFLMDLASGQCNHDNEPVNVRTPHHNAQFTRIDSIAAFTNAKLES